MSAKIRNYQSGDQAAAYFVCLKTGDHGRDGEPFYREDPDALGRIYVGPYLEFAPDFALVAEDEQGVCGYCLGVVDSKAFYDWYERHWRRTLCEQFPSPAGDSAVWSRVQEVHHTYHSPDYFCPEPYTTYPAHLHIDLLPRAQRKGLGRQMMNQLIDRLRHNRAAGVHLGMSERNISAYGFYKALGFEELCRNGDAIYMGQRLV